MVNSMEELTTDQNSCLLIGLTKKYQNKLRTKKIQAPTCDLQWDFHFRLNSAEKSKETTVLALTTQKQLFLPASRGRRFCSPIGADR